MAAAVGLGLTVLFSGSAKGAQVPIDPNGFTSLGTLSGFTTYVVNTGDGMSTPTLTENGSRVLNGQISNGVAVFDFSSIDLTSSSTLTATGALPLALLSRNGASLAGMINLNASGSTGGAGGGNGGTETAQATGQGASPFAEPSGGGFGGEGGNLAGEQGGATYGDSTHAFFGGSGGGVAQGSSAVGGGGGGGLEISALADVILTGTGGILANGAAGGLAGGVSQNFPGGGGSGGGIFLATPGQITSNAPLQAIGGAGGGSGGAFSGGGGGGGRILLEAGNFITGNPSLADVSGGGVGIGFNQASAGADGTFDVTAYVPVPEPTSACLAALSAAGLIRRSRRCRIH